MKATDAAWAAGIIDGEGTIGFYRARSRNQRGYIAGRWTYMISVTVGNTDLRMLDRLVEGFGARIYPMNHREGPTNRKPMWQWTVRGPRAVAMLRAIEPYLVTKREQARLVLSYRAGKPGLVVTDELIADREDLRRQLRILNKRGVA